MLGNVVLMLIIGLSAYSWWKSREKEPASRGKYNRRDHMDLLTILLCIYLLIDRLM